MPKLKVDLIVDDKGSLTVQQFASKSEKSLNLAAGAAGALAAGLGAIASAGAAREYIRMADAMTLIHGKMDLVGGDFERVYELANSTRQSLAPTVELYTRLARSTEEYGISQERLLAITESINQAAVVSSASQEEVNNAVRQLTQAMEGGIMRAEEFNSINEQTPRIMRMVADGLGKTKGELRAMMLEGKLSTDVLIEAMEKGAGAVNTEFAQMPETIGQAFTVLGNATTRAVGEIDQVAGSSDGLVASVHWLIESVELAPRYFAGFLGLIDGLNAAFVKSIMFISEWVLKWESSILSLNETIDGLGWLGDKLMPDSEVARSQKRVKGLTAALQDWQKVLDDIEAKGVQHAGIFDNGVLPLPAKKTPVGSSTTPGKPGAITVGTAAQNKYNAELAETNRLWREFAKAESEAEQIFRKVQTPAEEYAATIERLNYLFAETSMSEETFKRALLVAEDDYKSTMVAIEEQAEDTFGDKMENAVAGWASNFSGTLNDMVWSAELSFEGILESFGKMITEMLIQQAMVEPLMQGVGSVFDSFGSPAFNSSASAATGNYGPVPVAHTGWLVGSTPPASRSVSAGLFTGAPRFHNGLAADEFPAILQRGEEVIPRNMVGRQGSTPTIHQTINIDARGAEQGVESRIQQAVKDGANQGYQMMLKDFGTRGPGYGLAKR